MHGLMDIPFSDNDGLAPTAVLRITLSSKCSENKMDSPSWLYASFSGETMSFPYLCELTEGYIHNRGSNCRLLHQNF